MTRKLSTVLFLACFLAATAASAKVCFLPNVFSGNNDCLIGIRSVGDDPNDNGGVEPDPNNPCGPNAVSSFLTGEHTGLFAYFETAYGAGCWIVGCSGLYGSTSSPQSLNTSVFTVSSATYGGVTCHYATGCREPYKKECADGAPIATYNLDSLTCYQCDEQADCPTANSCAGYTVKSAPANGSLDGAPCQVVNSDCSNGDLLYKFKCNDGYEPQGTTCVAKECQGAYATEASKCASTGTCNGTWSIGLSTNGRSGDKYCYNCVCTGAQTCDVVTCGAEVSVPNNATCSNWCTPQDASCNPTGYERCTEWTCNTGYKKSGSGCVQKTCGDYSPYIYDSCTNKECDSQTCSSAPQAVGSGTKTCYTAPSGSCTVSCDTNPCNGYDTYTKPANSHWTSEACRYKYVSGTSCIDGGDWYKDWACNDGYTKSLDGKSCVMNASTPEEPTNTCTPLVSDSTPTYPKCYTKDTSADDGCDGIRTTYTYKCTENQTCTSTGCVDKCTPEPSDSTPTYPKCYTKDTSADDGCGGTRTTYTYKCTENQTCTSTGCAEPEKCETKYADGTTTKPGNGWTYSQDTVNGSPCYYNKVAKTCGDYSDYPYDSCTNKQCSSQTCSSTSKATGDSTTTCYKAPTGSCTTCADIGQWDSESACESANTCATCSKNNQTGCFIPTGCSSSCLSGITLQDFYSYSSYTYGTSKCYTLDGCASGWQSSACSGYSTTGWKSAHSSSTTCTQCEICTYTNKLSCEKVYWSCSSDTKGVSPMTATCWDGVCEKSIYKYQPANIPGADYDDRDCCMTSDATYCSDFLCDNSAGYIKSGNTCVCDTSAGWSNNADGTCYCPAGWTQSGTKCVKNSGGGGSGGPCAAVCEDDEEEDVNLIDDELSLCRSGYKTKKCCECHKGETCYNEDGCWK